MGKLGKPEKTTDEKKSENDEIDFPLEEISPAMYRKKKMEERKRKMSPEDGTKKWQLQEKIKLVDDLVSSAKKKKYPKQHNIPNDVVNCGRRKSEDLPEEPEEPIFNVREKLQAHKIVQYVEDSSSQHDNTAGDSNYYPSSQVSQDSLLEMGIKIESINKVEERRKEKMETSSRMINKNEPKVEERKKEKMETSSRVINKQELKVGERRKEKVETSAKMINKQKPKVEEIAVAEVMESDDNSEELEGGIFWKEFKRKMLRCQNFADIAENVDSPKIPDISLQRKTTMQPHDRKDRISQFLLPQDVDENLVQSCVWVKATARRNQ